MSVAQIHPRTAAAKTLGTLVWYAFGGPVEYVEGKRTVLPVTVSHGDLRTWFNELDLDTNQLPPEVRRVDKFRTVTSNARHRYDITNGRVELFVEEVSYNAELVTRHIMRRVTLDGQPSTVDHVATLKFIRGGRTANQRRTHSDHWKPAILSRVKDPDRPEVEAFIERIRAEYDDGAEGLDTTALRGMVRRYLSSLCGIQMRSIGGIYFVPTGHERVIAGLSEVISRINSSGCSLDYIPFDDSEHHREIAASAYHAEVIDECGNLERAIEARRQVAVSKGKLAPTQLAELRERLNAILAMAEVYDRLGLPLGATGEALESAANKLSELNPLSLRR